MNNSNKFVTRGLRELQQFDPMAVDIETLRKKIKEMKNQEQDQNRYTGRFYVFFSGVLHARLVTAAMATAANHKVTH